MGRKWLFFSLIVLVLIWLPQVACAQDIVTEFTEEVLVDGFDNNRNHWDQNSNAAMLCLISEGHLVVQQHTTGSSQMLYNELIPVLPNFHISVDIAFDGHKNKDQSAGVAFMVDEQKTTFYVMEINANRQYRLWSRRGDEHVYLTGGNALGWEKSNLLKPGKAINVLEIKCDSQRYEVYFNGIYAFSFADETMAPGRMALYIAPDTHVFFDQLQVLVKKEVGKRPLLKQEAPNNTPQTTAATAEQQIVALKREIEELRKKLELCIGKKP